MGMMECTYMYMGRRNTLVSLSSAQEFCAFRVTYSHSLLDWAVSAPTQLLLLMLNTPSHDQYANLLMSHDSNYSTKAIQQQVEAEKEVHSSKRKHSQGNICNNGQWNWHMEKGASNWLTMPPIDENGFTLHKGAFRDTLVPRCGWLLYLINFPPLHMCKVLHSRTSLLSIGCYSPQ